MFESWSLDPIDLAKAIAIMVTAAFGVLGALTHSRHRDTGRLTRWGWISMAGIVISALVGSITQIAEANAAKRKSQHDAMQARDLLATTGATLRQVERSLSRFGPRPPFFLQVSGDCRDPFWARFCAALPLSAGNAPVPLRALAALKADVATFVVTIERPGKGLEPKHAYASYRSTISLSSGNPLLRVTSMNHRWFHLDMTGSMVLQNGAGALSFEDLRGYHLYFYSDAPFLHVDLDQFSLNAEDGNQLYMESDMVHPVPDAARRRSHGLNFDYTIPNRS